jgi:DnaA family protein
VVILQQIPLNIRLDREATFANFFVSDASPNGQVLAALQELCSCEVGCTNEERYVYLWGVPGAGTSHLLQAACQQVQNSGRMAQYLPLAEVGTLDPSSLLDGLEMVDLLCLDDIQDVTGHPEWDGALFALFNRIREQHSCLLIAAKCAPKDLKCSLPDLASRLTWGLTRRLAILNDTEKPLALQKRAAIRGLDLGDEVAAFLLRHGKREPRELFACLDALDHVSLAEKRRLSIPFVKEVLGL